MAHLVPYPFGALVRRMLRELERDDSIFDLPRRKFVTGVPGADCSVIYAGHRASSPLGPAAGPHTQMAQNLVLAWLGGARILELKTVQVMDDLTIPRPCIDMRTVGFNAEWSQELTVEQSLAEYVKGMMLITILRDGGFVPGAPGFDDMVYDMSLGYDLAGISGDKVQGFVRGMRDASPLIDRFRMEIPREHARLRDLDFITDLSDTITLSTFHGCPPDEIERIVDYLMTECGLHTVIKFNPMLLGKSEVRRLLNEVLGYAHLHAPDAAFDRDVHWEMAVPMVERLSSRARTAGVTLGAKFSNTLVVENNAGYLPADQKEVYLSGTPLHVLAMQLVARFRDHFGDTIPISFAAGVDRANFPELVAQGMMPITVCSDLLKTGGYGRLEAYHRDLATRMTAVGADTVNEFTLKVAASPVAPGIPTANELSEARLRNTRLHAERVLHDPRYAFAANTHPPRKIGSRLKLFDCVSCDKCVPVCPNDANFTYPTVQAEIPMVRVEPVGSGWAWRQHDVLHLTEKHQIGTFADFCNECGNCDVFCPEDGGPYRIKPNFFGSRASWEAARPHEGLFIERNNGGSRLVGRCDGTEYQLEIKGDRVDFMSPAFRVRFRERDPQGTLQVSASGAIDLTWCFILNNIRLGVLAGEPVNYISSQYAMSQGES